MDVFDLAARLTLDTSEYEQSLNGAKNSTEKSGNSIAKTLTNVGKVIAGAAVTKAVIDFGKASVEAGMNFDKAMSQVAATMGYTVDEINGGNKEATETFQTLNNFAKEMGRTTAFSASEAAEALNYMALAGYDAQTSMDMLPTVLDLAAAGAMSLGSASDMVTDAQSALGLTLDETRQMVDQMAVASSKSNTSVSQLGEAFLTIGATARGIKGGTTELATILGVLADNGIKGAEGGTHLRNMLLSLQNPTSDAAGWLQEYNLQIYDSEGNMRSMIDIMGDLRTVTASMSQESKDAMLSGIFNKTDLAAVNALLNTTDERFEELTESISNADGAAKDMANTQLDNLAGDVTLWKSALEGAQIAISDALAPALRGFVQMGTEGLTQLTNAFTEGGLTGVLDTISTWINEQSPLLGVAFDALRLSVETAFDLIKTAWETVLKPALTALHEYLNNTVAPVARDVFENIIKPAVESVSTAVKTGWETIIKPALDAMQKFMQNTLAPAIKTVWENKIKPAIETASEGIKTSWETIIKPALDTMSDFMKNTLAPAVKDAWDNVIAPIVKATAKIIEAAWTGIIKPAMDAFQKFMASTVATNVKDAWEKTIKPAIDTVSHFIATTWETIIRPALESLSDKMNKAAETISTAWETIIKPAWESLKGGIDSMKQKFDEFHDNVVTIWNNIKNAIITPVQNAENTLKGIVERIKGIFNFQWQLPHIKMPHFQVTMVDYGIISLPSINVEWYKKAYETPYMFDTPTVMGFGDGVGGEMVYGHESLMNDIKTAMHEGIGLETPITLVVQSVLDGRVIGETAYDYSLNMARVTG